MAAIEAAIVKLAAQDASATFALSQEAHWNQTEDDWLLFLTKGRVFGVRDDVGRLVATAALLPFGGGTAWVSMVLVTMRSRRQGLATRLVQACLKSAAAQGLVPWLDATADGAAVYSGMGFQPSIALHRLRFAGKSGPVGRVDGAAEEVDALLARDRAAMQFDRAEVLRALAGRAGSKIVRCDQAIGLVRDGRLACQVGPVFADTAMSALDLVSLLVASDPQPHIIDAVADHATFVEGLLDRGWTLERSFRRMRFGPVVSPTNPPFAVAGPEYG